MAATAQPQIPGTVLLAGVVGSHAYGLAGPDSDIDIAGVYAADIDDVLGLNGASLTNTSVTTTCPDAAFHELGKFVRLCLKANPTVTELLWLDDYTVSTAAGDALIAVRSAMLSTATVRASYLGYARAQARKLHNRPAPGARAAKHGRHCLRLLIQAETLLATGTLQVDVGDYRDELFAAGTLAETDPDGYADLVSRRMDRLDRIYSVLPDRADVDVVNSTVVAIRHSLADASAGISG